MFNSFKKRIKNLISQLPTKSNYKFLIKDWKPLFELKKSAQILETKRFFQNMTTVSMDRPKGQRFLVLAPHCDDDTFGAGGVILKLREAGADVHVLYFCVPGRNEEDVRKIREEAEAICVLQGVIPHFLKFKTRNFIANEESLNKIREVIELTNPDVVFTTFLLDDHVDHREINNVLMQAIQDQNYRFQIWAYQIYSTVLPNVVVDITDKMERKMEVMEMWKSVQGNRNWAHYIKGMNAANCRFIPGRAEIYAETFFVVPVAEYLDLCRMYFQHPQQQSDRYNSPKS